MMKRTLPPVALMLLMLLSPSVLLANENVAGEELLGTWMLKSVEADGEKEEVEDDSIKVQFLADGKMKSWEEGEEEEGSYKVEGDTITIYEEGVEEGQAFKYKVEGDSLHMIMTLGEGGPEIKIHFAKVVE